MGRLGSCATLEAAARLMQTGAAYPSSVQLGSRNTSDGIGGPHFGIEPCRDELGQERADAPATGGPLDQVTTATELLELGLT